MRWLTPQQESLRVSALSAELEWGNARATPPGQKDLPRWFRVLWLDQKDVDEVRLAGLAIEFSASAAESHPRELLAKAFCFVRICWFLKTICQLKEGCSPLFICHDRIR
jgi:hypothetical protein